LLPAISNRKEIGPALTPEEAVVSLEDRPQAATRPEPSIIEHRGRASHPICAHDALVAVNRQQHTEAPPSGGATATIHSRRNCSRKKRSSIARADRTSLMERCHQIRRLVAL
jgi:hypothetical protein